MSRTPSPFIVVVLGLLLLVLIFAFLRRNIFSAGSTANSVPPLPTLAVNTVDNSAEINPNEHIVQAGETLGGIAQQYGVSLDALVSANNISNPNIVQLATRLTIPDPVAVASQPVDLVHDHIRGRGLGEVTEHPL